MDDLCAPQWADFTCSPQRPSDSYFEIIHELHEPQLQLKTSKVNSSSSCKIDDVTEISHGNTCKNNSPTNVPNVMPNNNKKQMVEEITNDNVLHEAMTKLELDGKSRKARATWSQSVHNLPLNTCKTATSMQKKKYSLLENVRRSARLAEKKENIQPNGHCFEPPVLTGLKQKEQVEPALKKNTNESNIKLDTDQRSEHITETSINKRLSYKIDPYRRRQTNKLTTKQCSLERTQPRVLTCQYRRRSLIKYRRRSDKFISWAESILKFQNETPDRFRTISNKDLKPGPLLKMKRSPLKLTQPISPALRCKQRTRHTRLKMIRQEREAQEQKDMENIPIKAKPVPVNILKGPVAMKKVPKKPSTVTVEFHLTQPKRIQQSINPLPAPCQVTNTKEQHHKNTANSNKNLDVVPHKNPDIVPHKNFDVAPHKNFDIAPHKNSDVIIHKRTAKSIAYTLPITFEARNKEFQMKKEQKLKELQIQETAKMKAGFHARPAPNFPKAVNSVKEHVPRKSIVPRPFSFEARDKYLAKRKEEQVKQMKEENTKPHVFHANPVPSFKPVVVHGWSKTNPRAKEKTEQSLTKTAIRLTKSYCDQENKQPNISHNSTFCLETKKAETKRITKHSELNKEKKTGYPKIENKKPLSKVKP